MPGIAVHGIRGGLQSFDQGKINISVGRIPHRIFLFSFLECAKGEGFAALPFE